MYCSKCGKQIDDAAVICVGCGVPTQNFKNQQTNSQQPITIVNAPSASSSASASASSSSVVYHRTRRHHNFLFDLFMIFITGGIWIIWMIFRPKYY